MKPIHIFLLAATLTACCLSSCQTARQATPRTLILFYDPGIGPRHPFCTQPNAAEATLVYHYADRSTASPCPSPAAKPAAPRHAACDGLKASMRCSPTDTCRCH